MKCVWWLVYTWSLVTVSSEAMLKEGDNYSLECSSPGWKYCSWRHEVSGGGGDDDEGGGGGGDDDVGDGGSGDDDKGGDDDDVDDDDVDDDDDDFFFHTMGMQCSPGTAVAADGSAAANF